MKKYIVLLAVLLMAAGVQADFLGVKKASETIAFPVHKPLDSAGCPDACDSIQVFTYPDDDATVVYKATGAGYACAGIDTTKDYGGTNIWYVQTLSTIDGTAGNFTLGIEVVTWAHLLPTYTFAQVQIVTDSLEDFLDAPMDSCDAKTTSRLAPAGTVAAVTTVNGLANNVITAASMASNCITSDEIAATGAAEIADAAGDSVWSATVTAVASRTVTVSNITNIADACGDSTWSTTVTAVTSRNVIAYGMPDSVKSKIADATADSVWDDHVTAVASRTVTASGGTIARADSIGAGGVDGIWNEDQATHATAGSFGLFIDAALTTLPFFDPATTPVMVKSIEDTAQHNIARHVWGYDADTAWAAGTMGDSSNTWGETGAGGTGLDSAETWAVVFNAMKTYVNDSTVDWDTLLAHIASAGIDSATFFELLDQWMTDSAMSITELFDLVDSAAGNASFNPLDTVQAKLVDIQPAIIDSNAFHADAITASKVSGNVARENLDTLKADSVNWPTNEDLYRNIDTTKTVDTSGLGTWFVNNVGGAGGTDSATIAAIVKAFGGGINNGLANVTLTYYTYDTVNSDAVGGAVVTFMTSGGVSFGTAITNAAGYVTAHVETGATYYVTTRNPVGYSWEITDTIAIDTGIVAQTDSAFGAYTLSLFTPSDSFLCRVYGYLHNIGGAVVQDARVVMSLGQLNVQDTCNGVLLANYNVSTTTDATGYWYLDIVRSKCLKATDQKYKLSITYPGSSQTSGRVITVPDSASYQVKW